MSADIRQQQWCWKCLDCNAWTMNVDRGQHECGNCGVIKPMAATLLVCDFSAPSAMTARYEAQRVTRFEVVDESGRVYTCRPCAIELSYQDGGRTLKVFVRKGEAA